MHGYNETLNASEMDFTELIYSILYNYLFFKIINMMFTTNVI